AIGQKKGRTPSPVCAQSSAGLGNPAGGGPRVAQARRVATRRRPSPATPSATSRGSVGSSGASPVAIVQPPPPPVGGVTGGTTGSATTVTSPLAYSDFVIPVLISTWFQTP